MANTITFSRIMFSIALLFLPALSPAFYAVYVMAGLTDMLDGTVARKTGTASEFGSRLDTTADFIFVMVCLCKLLPAVALPVWLYLWGAVVALIKGINMARGAAVHTVLNKVAGAVLFAFPLTFSVFDVRYSAVIVCVIATFAAVREGHDIKSGS